MAERATFNWLSLYSESLSNRIFTGNLGDQLLSLFFIVRSIFCTKARRSRFLLFSLILYSLHSSNSYCAQFKLKWSERRTPRELAHPLFRSFVNLHSKSEESLNLFFISNSSLVISHLNFSFVKLSPRPHLSAPDLTRISNSF